MDVEVADEVKGGQGFCRVEFRYFLAKSQKLQVKEGIIVGPSLSQ